MKATTMLTDQGARRRSPRFMASPRLASPVAAQVVSIKLTLSMLPTELLSHIVRQLACMNVKAVRELQQCNAQWNMIISNQELWRDLCDTTLPDCVVPRTLFAAGAQTDFRAFFVKRACGTYNLRSIHEGHLCSLDFPKLEWTVEVFVAPIAWEPGDVHPLVYTHTTCLPAMPNDGYISFGPSALRGTNGSFRAHNLSHGARLCTVKGYELETEHDGPVNNIWARWIVHREDGKATCIYEGNVDDWIDRPGLLSGLASGAEVKFDNFAEGFHSDRCYHDQRYGFASVSPSSGVTLAEEDGWLILKSVFIGFLLDFDDGGVIESLSTDDGLICSYLNDHDWK
jgi:hypothetical protein